jgi:hypothetical protein
MTLVDVLLYLKNFGESLRQIIEEIDYKGYDQVIKNNSRTITNSLRNIKFCVLNKSPFYPYTNMIYIRVKNMIENSDLAETFSEKNINLFGIFEYEYSENDNKIIFELLDENYAIFDQISNYLSEQYKKKYS